MNRRERIITLLDHYLDVENGLQDRAFRGDDYLPRMCRAWSHPSYVELRRIVGLLQWNQPRLFHALAETYFRYTERRVAYCPRCRQVDSSKYAGTLHKHGQRTVTLVYKTVRVQRLVDREVLSEAIDWLEHNFRGEPFVPDDLLEMVA